MFLIYGKEGCVGCKSAKELVEAQGKVYQYVDVEEDMDSLRMLVGKGLRSLPQIYYNDEYIGGWRELQEYIKEK